MRTVESPTAPVWVALRLVLAVVYVLVIAGVALTYRSTASLQALYDDVRTGATSQVELVGGLPPGSSGSAVQTAQWQTGLRRWTSELLVQRPPGQRDGFPVTAQQTSDDVAAEVRGLDPDVRVVTSEHRSGFSPQLYGVRLPLLIGIPALLGTLAGIVLLVGGPQPYRATRWAWFWLSGMPGGALAFLALSGPTPGLRTPPPGEPRLTGGRAFFVALIVGAILSAAVSLLVSVIWPAR